MTSTVINLPDFYIYINRFVISLANTLLTSMTSRNELFSNTLWK